MEIGRRIRELRTRDGLSQDDLAARVYVSRQTISSWENAKTYPDVQSILLLSQIFGTSTDDLIKGDVETMAKTIDKDVRTLKNLGYVMTAFALLMIAALVWFAVQLVVWGWPLAQTLPTALLALVLWGIVMAAAMWADKIKREHDLATYQEVLSYWRGEPVDRDTERSRRERLIPSWMKAVRAAGLALLAAAVGFLCGYHLSALLDALFG